MLLGKHKSDVRVVSDKYWSQRIKRAVFVREKKKKKETTEIYCPTVLGARSMKSSCQQGHVFSDGFRGASFLVSSSFWSLLETLDLPQLTDASLKFTQPSSRCLCLYIFFPLCMYVSLSKILLFIRTLVILD